MGRMTHRLASILAFAGLLAAAPVHAQVFKCVDEKGKTVYSQTPCPGATVLDSKPKPPARSSNYGTTPAAPEPAKPAAKDAAAKGAPKDAKPPPTPEEAFQKRQQERAEAEKKSAEQAAAEQRKQEECRRAKEQVAQYAAGGRIARIDDKGERYYLEDSQIESEKAKWEAQAQAACR